MNFAMIQHISAPFYFSFCTVEGIFFRKINNSWLRATNYNLAGEKWAKLTSSPSIQLSRISRLCDLKERQNFDRFNQYIKLGETQISEKLERTQILERCTEETNDYTTFLISYYI